jgi:hypothetical protein
MRLVCDGNKDLAVSPAHVISITKGGDRDKVIVRLTDNICQFVIGSYEGVILEWERALSGQPPAYLGHEEDDPDDGPPDSFDPPDSDGY